MAETKKTSSKYTLQELYIIRKLAMDYAGNINYFIANNPDDLNPKDKEESKFFNEFIPKIDNEIKKRLKDIDNELSI